MQSNKQLTLILILILIINLILLFRIGDLHNRMQSLRQNYNNLQSNINSISGNVNNALNQFTREQSWITPVQINNDKSHLMNEQVEAVLNWQIKDYPEASKVVFHYRESEDGEFKDIPAESKGAGLFEVSIPLAIKVKPFWDIQVTKTEKIGRKTTEAAIKPEKPGYQAINYYVSMKAKDTIKSSEVSYFDLGHLTHTKYEPIRGHVDINNNKYSISLFEHYPSSNDNFKSVMVKFYDGSNLVAEKAAEVQDVQNSSKTYFLTYAAGSQHISHLVIQVEYPNGNTFEKEIY